MLENVTRELPRMVTIKQAARLGVLPEHCLRSMQKRGELPGFNAGSRFYINLDKLVAKLEGTE